MNTSVAGDILLVGDGDFSLTVSLLRYNAPSQITTTSLESEESILKHKDAFTNRQHLVTQGVRVVLGVNACHLDTHPEIGAKPFQRIIFNFPHAGGKSNHKKNRKLLDDFFHSAVSVLDTRGQVMMTLCKGQGGTPADKPRRAWADSWQVASMAANAGLILSEIHPFDPMDFPGYFCTGFRSQDKWFHIDGALTHVFTMAGDISVPTLSEVTSGLLENHLVTELNRNLLEEPGHPLCCLVEQLTQRFCQYWSTRVIPPECDLADVPEGSNESRLEVDTCDVVRRLLTGPAREKLAITARPVQRSSGQFESIPQRFQLTGLYRVDGTSGAEVSEQREVFLSYIQTMLGELCHSSPLQDKCHILIQEEMDQTESDLGVLDFNLHYRIVLQGGNSSVDCGQVYINTSGPECEQVSGHSLVISLWLDTLLCHLCDINDLRLLWSRDQRFHSQFPPERVCSHKFVPFSLYPLTFSHDMSFWVTPDVTFDEQLYFHLIRSVAGLTVRDVTLRDTYTDVNTSCISRCYRLTFQSCDQAMSYSTSWQLQSTIRLVVAHHMGITLR